MTVFLNRKTRRVVFAVLLAMLFITATSVGSVWHHHSSVNSEAACPICHLGHQTAHQTIVVHAAPSLWSAASKSFFLDPLSPEGPIVSRIASRAPPSL